MSEKETQFIPLLSPKPFGDYSPNEFREYVRSLYRVKEKAAPKKKTNAEKTVRAKRKKKGGLSLVTLRKPKYITDAEFRIIAEELKTPLNLLFIELKELSVRIAEHREIEAEAKNG